MVPSSAAPPKIVMVNWVGIRPRLTPDQRKDILAAIKKIYQGVRNYQNPLIIDGMIEGIR